MLGKCLHDINLLAQVLAPNMNISNVVPGKHCTNTPALWEIQECTFDFNPELAYTCKTPFSLKLLWNDFGAWIMEMGKIQS